MAADLEDLLLKCSLKKLIAIVELQKAVLLQQENYKNILNRYEFLFDSVINQERENTEVNESNYSYNKGELLNSIKVNENSTFCSRQIRFNTFSVQKEDISVKITSSYYNNHNSKNPSTMGQESTDELWESIHRQFLKRCFSESSFSERCYSERSFSKQTFSERRFSENNVSELSILRQCLENDLKVLIEITERFLLDTDSLKEEFSNEKKKSHYFKQAIANERKQIQEIESKLLEKHREKSNILTSLKEFYTTTDTRTDEIGIEDILFEISELESQFQNSKDITNERIYNNLKVLESSLVNELSNQTYEKENINKLPHRNLKSKQSDADDLEKMGRSDLFGYEHLFFVNDLSSIKSEKHDKYRKSVSEHFTANDNDTTQDDKHDNTYSYGNIYSSPALCSSQLNRNNSDVNSTSFNEFTDDMKESAPNFNSRKVIRTALKYLPQCYNSNNVFAEINPNLSIHNIPRKLSIKRKRKDFTTYI